MNIIPRLVRRLETEPGQEAGQVREGGEARHTSAFQHVVGLVVVQAGPAAVGHLGEKLKLLERSEENLFSIY